MSCRKLTVQTVLDKFKEIHGDTYEYQSFVQYVDTNQRIQIHCKACSKPEAPYSFQQQIRVHLRGNGCMQCARRKNSLKATKTFNQFVEEARAVHGYKFEYSAAESCYRNYSERIPIQCKTCQRVFMQLPTSHTKGVGCKMCQAKATGLKINQRAAASFIDKMKAVHGSDDIGFDLVEYQTADTRVKLFCKRCNEVYMQKPVHALLGSKCQRCVKKSELKLMRFLREAFPVLSLSEQVYFKDLKDRGYLYFDFHLQSDQGRVIIELDGKQHFKPVSVFGGETAFLQGKRRDQLKEQYLRDHSIPLIRIYQPDVWSGKGQWQQQLQTAIKNALAPAPVLYTTIGSAYVQ